MARFKLGFGFSDIRGKIGNYVYSIGKTGVSTVRQVAQSISNPSSPDQTAIRCNLAKYAGYWSNDISVAQRTLWEAWAATKPGMGNKDGGVLTIIKGNSGDLSGINAYVMSNQWLRSCAMAGVDDAPLGATPPGAPTNVAASWLTPTLTVTWTAPVVKKAGAQCRIWLMNHQGLVHRQLVAYAPAAQGTIDITTVKGAQGLIVALASAPGSYSIQMDTVDADGTKSGPSGTTTLDIT
jgi:hypothetical protein